MPQSESATLHRLPGSKLYSSDCSRTSGRKCPRRERRWLCAVPGRGGCVLSQRGGGCVLSQRGGGCVLSWMGGGCVLSWMGGGCVLSWMGGGCVLSQREVAVLHLVLWVVKYEYIEYETRIIIPFVIWQIE
uniref:Uncharacterized protein n=1 Tax=Catharus ustulatus TaxID=91951 RepID=A0A8C3UZI3_CATUS